MKSSRNRKNAKTGLGNGTPSDEEDLPNGAGA